MPRLQFPLQISAQLLLQWMLTVRFVFVSLTYAIVQLKEGFQKLGSSVIIRCMHAVYRYQLIIFKTWLGVQWFCHALRFYFSKSLTGERYSCLWMPQSRRGLAAPQLLFPPNYPFSPLFLLLQRCQGRTFLHKCPWKKGIYIMWKGSLKKRNGVKVVHSLQQQPPFLCEEVGRRYQVLRWQAKGGRRTTPAA